MGFLQGMRQAFGITGNVTPTPVQPSMAPSMGMTPLGYGWTGTGTNIPPDDSYDNVFPYVNPIAQQFSTFVPYAVDENLNRITPTPPALQALYTPNNAQSFRQFMQLLAATLLTQTHADILIWTRKGNQMQPGGTITPDNIAGYTMLPQNCRQYVNERADWTYQTKITLNGQTQLVDFTRNEVLSLQYSTHPIDNTRGISPAMTVTTWASVDDLMGSYEQGFFRNGAIPAGQLAIVAESAQSYSQTVRELQSKFQGADNANKISYSWIPIDPESGKPSTVGKLTWIPYSSDNNKLDIASLNTVVNNRLASAMGVPDIVRGIDTGQTYANAEQSKASFIETTLQPLLLTVWDKWQFELDRIIGGDGLGYGITFDLALPEQTDMENVRADTQNKQVNSFILLLQNGATAVQAQKALGLPEEFANISVSAPKLAAKKKQSISIRLTHETLAKTTADKAYDDALTVTRTLMNGLIDHGLSLKAAHDDQTNQLILDWETGILEAYKPEMLAEARKQGQSTQQAFNQAAAADPKIAMLLENYTASQIQDLYDWDDLPDTYKQAYQQRIEKVAGSITDNAHNVIQSALQQADAEQWTYKQLKDTLAATLTQHRAQLIARNELLNSQRLADLYAVKNMSEDTGVRMMKQWHADLVNPCPLCESLDGTTIPLDESFMGEGEQITVEDHTYVNDWMSVQTASAHPNCRCQVLYAVEGHESDLNDLGDNTNED